MNGMLSPLLLVYFFHETCSNYYISSYPLYVSFSHLSSVFALYTTASQFLKISLINILHG